MAITQDRELAQLVGGQASYDYIIVGAGAAGAVLAGRLSADPGSRVLLLEAGPPDDKTEIRIPAAFSRLFQSPYDWSHATAPQPGLDGRESYWAGGRTLGGSTSINAMLYLRGNPLDYDTWDQRGAAGWGWEDVLPSFKRSERNARGANRWHGDAGPLHVQDQRDPSPLSRAFVAAAQAAGVPFNADFNGARQDGVGWIQVTQRRGRRWSAADAFLRPALGRPNLTVLTEAQATRVLLEGERAVGVEYVRRGQRHSARAEREVVLSAGAVRSPQLLLLSGIGPAAHLRELGIGVVVDLPGVGQNLYDHVVAGVSMATTRPLSLLNGNSPLALADYLLRRRGPLASSVGEAAVFARTRPGLPAPDLELVFAPSVFVNSGRTAPTEHGMTIGVALMAPQSVGSLRLRSADPLEQPLIDPRYFSDPDGHDLAVMVAGVRLAQQIFAAEPLRSLVARPITPERELRDDAEIAAYVQRTADAWWHPVGTCRIGEDPLAVVDPALRVHGVEGLRVADASVMPTVPRGHTMAPSIMIGERAADFVLGRVAGGGRAVAV